MKWILILTLFSPYEGGATMMKVDFANRDECMAAGNAWLQDIKRRKSNTGYAMTTSAVCVTSGNQ